MLDKGLASIWASSCHESDLSLRSCTILRNRQDQHFLTHSYKVCLLEKKGELLPMMMVVWFLVLLPRLAMPQEYSNDLIMALPKKKKSEYFKFEGPRRGQKVHRSSCVKTEELTKEPR